MRAIILALTLTLAIGCSSLDRTFGPSTDIKGTSSEEYRGYQPIDPLPADTVMRYNKEIQDMEEKLWAALVAEPNVVRGLLPIQSAEVSVSKIDAKVGLSYLAASLTGEVGTYTVIMDYMKYRVEDVYEDDTNDFIGNARIGVGLRIKAVVQTTEANLNLGSLVAIGAQARLGTLRGGIAVDVIGIDSPDVVNLIPLTSEIDQTSIQSALQALASIKTKISDENIRLTPHVLAIKQAKNDVKQRIKQRTSIARRRGFEEGQKNIRMKKEILARVAPGDTLDKVAWDRLVDASTLEDAVKSKLKALNNFKAVNSRLDLDAAMGGDEIGALHEALRQL
jgi:hypothetical protein